MSRSLLILVSDTMKAKAKKWIDAAAFGTRVEFRESKRSIPQNDRMWAALTDVSKQRLHVGRQYPPEVWKILFMHRLDAEIRFIPDLDNVSWVPLGYQSSELSVTEMSELIELIIQWGTEHGVIFHDPLIKEAAE